MAIRDIEIVCRPCRGSGMTEEDHTDGPSTIHGCPNCGGQGERGSPFRDNAFRRGRGRETVQFVETGARCPNCDGRGGHPGLYETTEEGWDRSGRRYRQVSKGYHNPTCSHCLGTGRELRKLERAMCPECQGKGKKKVWKKEKVFFMATGREIQVDTDCGNCGGTGWVRKVVDRVFTGDADYRLP